LVDLKAGTMTIPAALAKRRREHRIYLTELEVGLLREQLLARAAGTSLVFPTVEGRKWTANRATSEPLQTSVAYMYSFTPETGESESIGSWFPDLRGQSGAVNLTFCDTDDAETAERWRAELAAGQLPDQR
jgi:hypothetical protein